MIELASQIKEIEEHLDLKYSGVSEDILGGLSVKLGEGDNSLDLMKAIYKDFGPGPQFSQIRTNYIKRLQARDSTYLRNFYKATGADSGKISFSSERKLKGNSGKLRPSRRRLNAKYSGAECWNIPLTDFINSLNYKKHITTDLSEVQFELSKGSFSATMGSLVDITVEDILQHVALNIRNTDDIITAGFVGIRTEEYGGDVIYNLSYSPSKTTLKGENIVKSCFDRYQFDISCLVSTITVSSPFNIEDFSEYDLGLDPSKKYYLGSFVCLASRHFNHFSSLIPSPFVYLKPMVVLFEEDGWVHYNQTDWVEVPSFLLNTCYEIVNENMYREYA